MSISKKTNYRVALLALALIGHQAGASNLEIPNQFSAGTKAVADQVNTNFSATADAVNDNQAQLTSHAEQLEQLSTALEALSATLLTQQQTIADQQQEIALLQSEDSSQLELITELQASNSALQSQVVEGLPDIMEITTDLRGNPVVIFSGVNLHINNGLGSTNSLNELGNLIIGYDEEQTTNESYPSPEMCTDGQIFNQVDCEAAEESWSYIHKSGSHNLVLGSLNNYSRSASIVAGSANNSLANRASTLGGTGNFVRGAGSVVVSGQQNTNSGGIGVIVGGSGNTILSGTFREVILGD